MEQLQRWVASPLFSAAASVVKIGLLIAILLALREIDDSLNYVGNYPDGSQLIQQIAEDLRSLKRGY